MDEIIQGFLGNIQIGTEQSHCNMRLYCLLSAKDFRADFLTLDEALDQNALTITEVSERGSVPRLRVINKSDQKVLLLDGEEFAGAKQNRVLNVTVLVAEASDTIIPVGCVEQQIWSCATKEGPLFA